eukprot:3047561-Lingulodinium_polyedra.AAC.1
MGDSTGGQHAAAAVVPGPGAERGRDRAMMREGMDPPKGGDGELAVDLLRGVVVRVDAVQA